MTIIERAINMAIEHMERCKSAAKQLGEPLEQTRYYEWECILSSLRDMKAADVAPVRHGRWVKHDGYTECSECEYWYYSAESEDAGDRPNYCPNCGAKMDGGQDV